MAHLLQLGADPLGPSVSHFRSTMCHAALLCTQAVADAFLAYFEGQRAAGGLCGMSAQRAMLLLEVVAMLGHASLAAHAAAELERACEGPAGQGGMLDEDALQRLIVGAARSTHDTAADMLRELLRSRLPFELAPPSPTYVPLLAVAVEGGPVEEKSRVLHAAGAPLTAQALLHAIEVGPRSVRALLVLGSPPADTSRVTGVAGGHLSYSCPVHRVLHSLVRLPVLQPGPHAPVLPLPRCPLPAQHAMLQASAAGTSRPPGQTHRWDPLPVPRRLLGAAPGQMHCAPWKPCWPPATAPPCGTTCRCLACCAVLCHRSAGQWVGGWVGGSVGRLVGAY